MIDQVLVFLETHASLAGWAGAVGSTLAVFAGFMIGRTERWSKQKAYALSALALMDSSVRTIWDEYSNVWDASNEKKEDVEKEMALANKYHIQSEKNESWLKSFQVEQLNPRAVKPFHRFRVEFNLLLSFLERVMDDDFQMTEGEYLDLETGIERFLEKYQIARRALGYNAREDQAELRDFEKRRQKKQKELNKK